MFKAEEFQALHYSELPMLAGYIYTGVFLYFVDHSTQTAQVSDAHIRDLLTTKPKMGSKKPAYIPTRQEIRWAIKQLIAEGLLEVKTPGVPGKKAPVYWLPLTYKKPTTIGTTNLQSIQNTVNTGNTARLQAAGTAIGTTREQPRNSQPEQPGNSQPQNEETQGFQANQHTEEQPTKNGEEPHLYYNTNKTICIGDQNSQNFPTTKTQPETPFSRFKKQDVINHFLNQGSDKDLAEQFFNHYESVNWHRPQSGPIMKFEPVASQWLHKRAMQQMKQQPTRATNHAKPNATQNLMEMAILHRQKLNQGGQH